LSVKAFVVPPLSRQQVLAGVWPGELMPRTRSPRRLRDAQAMMIRR
jgi:hypothetical protein